VDTTHEVLKQSEALVNHKLFEDNRPLRGALKFVGFHPGCHALMAEAAGAGLHARSPGKRWSAWARHRFRQRPCAVHAPPVFSSFRSST
jgi:hypothetical protein